MVGLTKRQTTTSARENYENQNLNRFGKGNVESGRYERKPKNKIVGRSRSNTSRVGVGTLEKVKPKRKDMTGVNQTPITGKDVVKSVGEGALEGALFGVGGAGVKALNKFSKTNLLKRFKSMFKNNPAVQKFFPKSVKRITDKRTRGEKAAAMKKEIADLKRRGQIGNKKNVRADENPNLTPAERAGGESFKKGGMVKKKTTAKKTAAKKTTRKPAARVARKGIDGIAKRGKTRAARSR